MLEGITVLDLSRRFPGGYASLWLADLGAEVIRIESMKEESDYRSRHPKVNDIGFTYATTGRNKKSIALNLKEKQGHDVFMKLASKSNVIIEGFKPGVATRLGIDYESVKKINDSIIYGSISGYGQKGFMQDKPGFDINYQAISGILSLSSSSEEKPNLSGLLQADIGAGLVGAISIISALFQQQRTNKGAYIDIAMADVPFHLISASLMHSFATGTTEYFANGTTCSYNVYQCRCGKWIALSGVGPKFWKSFCQAVGRPDWENKQSEPATPGNETFDELTKLFKEKSQEEWLKLFDRNETCISPVVSAGDVWNSEWAKDRSLTFKIPNQAGGELPQVRLPFTLNDSHGISGPIPGGDWEATCNPKYPPRHGQHTLDILNNLGISEKEIQSLSDNEIVKIGK